MSSSLKWLRIFFSLLPLSLFDQHLSRIFLFILFFLCCYSFPFMLLFLFHSTSVFEFLIQRVLLCVKILVDDIEWMLRCISVVLCFTVAFLVVWEVRNVFTMWKALIFTSNFPLQVALCGCCLPSSVQFKYFGFSCTINNRCFSMGRDWGEGFGWINGF